MPADKPRPTLADYVTIVLSPALIMAMIVSLVFFLLAIFYRGEFANRLHTISFFFIFGIVLVARIAMETGHSDRAPVYGGVLAFLTWLGMGNFVTYPSELAAPSWLINGGLIGLAWWLSYQLVYSCTYIDEKAESTGTGIMQAAGLEKPPPKLPKSSLSKEGLEDAADERPSKKNSNRDKKRPTKLTWWVRYQRFRAEQKQKQPPGVWVVYFALAALPIFGLGQALIDVAEVERRSNTFSLMALYLTSSLGLLVTTAFLGLRRYLRQRRLEMPKMVTAAWLTLGAALVGTFVVIGAALPRPQSEFSPFDLARAGSKEKAASKYAITRGDPGKGEGRPGAQESDPDGDPVDDKDSNRSGKGKGKNQGSGSKVAEKDTAKKQEKNAGQNKKLSSKQNGEQNNDPAPEVEPPLPRLTEIATKLKWIVFALMALVTVFFILRGGLKYLANFCDWASRLLESLHRFWERLLGGGRKGKDSGDDADEFSFPTPAPFHTFANPFHSRRADKMNPAELVRYSFEALEAWAGESAYGRGTEETPIEFTDRLAEEVGRLDKETKDLGTLYARVLYARGNLPSDWRGTVEKFWNSLDAAI